MSFKYLKSKEKVVEAWNPILTGGTIQGGSNLILPPGSFNPTSNYSEPGNYTNNAQQPCNDMIDKPAWLDNDDPTLVRNGDILSIGTYYINGVPLSAWGTNFGGAAGYGQKQIMMNWYYIDALTKQLFPDGIKAYINKDDDIDYNITKLSILRIVPNSNAIGLNIYIRFELQINGEPNEIWGKFDNVGLDMKPKFMCQELQTLDLETTIKITGKLWNIISNWFKAKTGIYKCLAKEVLVYSELGQLKKLSEGNVIEVLSSDETKIKVKYDNTVYFIKRPTYYWFNWNFKKY